MKPTIKHNQAIKYIFLITVALTAVCAGSNSRPTGTQSDQDIAERAEQIVSEMTGDEKVGQLFMVYWIGLQPSRGLQQLIRTYEVGSVLIWGRNFTNTENPTAAQQVATLTNTLQSYAWENNKKISSAGNTYFLPLFIAADHEGDGPRYTRIRSGMTSIPSPLAIGATWSTANAEEVGQIVGRELRAIGVNMVLGPVIDVVDRPSTQGLGNLDVRVFGGNPQWVGELGRAYIRGIHEGSQNKIVTVAKHFPGHGDSNRATDKSVAITNKTLEELLSVDLVPFLRVTQLDDSDPLGTTDGLMTSHIAIANTDKEPVSLFYDEQKQRGGITALLQDVSGFHGWYADGFIVSDSLGVGAIKNRFAPSFPAVPIASDAFLAGNDLLILHNFFAGQGGENLPSDEEAQQNMRDVIEYFRKRYASDPSFAARVDEAARKIVLAKLRLYPELTLEFTLVDISSVEIATDDPQNVQTINKIAEEAITLLKPSSVDELPPPPAPNDNIVFVVHNVGVPACEKCIDDWRPLKRDNLANFVVQERAFPAESITSIYYYRDLSSSPAGLTTFLYGFWLGTGDKRDAITSNEALNIELALAKADWIIFAMVAGDCGPDAPAGDCIRGREEADTLHLFLEYVDNKPDMRAKIAAIAFGAPPWRLDSTDAAGLDVYYGAFNQLEPFQRQAMRAVLQEFIPRGASPLGVDAVGYFLEDALAPDPTQTVSLEILNRPSVDLWKMGDVIEIRISGVVDKNGHVVLDGTPVIWQGKYDGSAMLVLPQSSETETTSGEAGATFALDQPGRLDLSAKISDLESEHLIIEVQIQPTPTIAPTVTNMIAETPVSVTHTPTTTPSAVANPRPDAFNLTSWLADNALAILAGLGAIITVPVVVVIKWRVDLQEAKIALDRAPAASEAYYAAKQRYDEVKDLRKWLMRYIAKRQA